MGAGLAWLQTVEEVRQQLNNVKRPENDGWGRGDLSKNQEFTSYQGGLALDGSGRFARQVWGRMTRAKCGTD